MLQLVRQLGNGAISTLDGPISIVELSVEIGDNVTPTCVCSANNRMPACTSGFIGTPTTPRRRRIVTLQRWRRVVSTRWRLRHCSSPCHFLCVAFPVANSSTDGRVGGIGRTTRRATYMPCTQVDNAVTDPAVVGQQHTTQRNSGSTTGAVSAAISRARSRSAAQPTRRTEPEQSG